MSYYKKYILKHSFFAFIFVYSSLIAGTSGKISGVVTNQENGEPLIGCNVMVDGTSLGAATNLDGTYFILNVPPGVYTLRASMIGYGTVRLNELLVIVDLTAKANFSLSTKIISGQEVVVTAKRPTVRLDQTSMSAVVSAEDIENLPVTDVGDLIELQAGVVRDQNGGFHIRGGRSGEVSFWVDGVSTTDAYDGSSGLEVETSGIQEVQIISGTFNAEYGQAMSGIVNVVTKDGGQDYAGSMDFYIGGYHTYHSDLYSISSPFDTWKSFSDDNDNGQWDYGEILYDLNGNGIYDDGESYWDVNGNNQWDGDDGTESINNDVGYDGYLGDYYDANGDGNYTQPSLGEGNGRKDWGEHTFSLEDNGYTNYLNILNQSTQQINFSGHLSGPVPLIPTKLTFYSNVRYFKSAGRFYGKNLFLPNGDFGDESIVPLSPFQKASGQFKISWKPTSTLKLSLSTFLAQKQYRGYDSYYKYNPNGLQWNYESDQSHIFSLTHSLSPKTFYEIKVLNFSTSYWQHLYQDLSNVPNQNKILSASEFSNLNITDSISIRSGYDVYSQTNRYSYSENSNGTYSVIDHADTEGYLASDAFQTPAWSFGFGGTQNGRFSRNTSFTQFKYDLSSQVNSVHFIKMGILFKKYDIWANSKYINYKNVGEWSFSASGDTLGFNPLGGSRLYPFTPVINPTYTTSHNYMRVYPIEGAIYIQDKIELNELILNLGLRLDYFDPKWKTPKDNRLPENRKYYLAATQHDTLVFWEHEFESDNSNITILDSVTLEGAVKLENLFSSGVTYDSTLGTYQEAFIDEINGIRSEYQWAYGYDETKSTFQISPRIGIAYPISDRGVIHVSYGHFFQIPHFSYLFDNPEFEISNNNNGGILGNAALKPEKTVMYEIGMKQEVAPLTSVDLTIFYRDTRDWVGISAPIKKYPVGNYRKFENKDYANTRGFTIVLDRRFHNGFGAGVDYSWMVAEGTYSNPTDSFFDAQNNQAPRLSMIPLDWDQTHTLNMRASIGGKNWMTSIIGKYWSGKPYTPEFKTGSVSGAGAFAGFSDNSDRRPNVFNIDLRSSYQIHLLGYRATLYANIYNLLDIRNELSVWSDTGRATYTLTAKDVDATHPTRIGHLNEHLLKPEWYSEPRKVNLGFNISF
ncbi:MAG: TonB-dependent receptor plug domain-containing protein [Candidatus Marinimicrobia bacterium]|nr:TonB-dependent receptor plug domain-containing protein [Candidatus Neomarinimicrobiota bacterium]